MIIELDPHKSRDGVLVCFIFCIVNAMVCDEWKWWHIAFRFVWISFISGLIQFSHLHSVLKSLTVVRLFLTMVTFGIFPALQVLLFVHKDINTIINGSTQLANTNTGIELLMMDIQCSYMQTLCASLWYYIALAKHFGFLNEWKFVLKTIIPHALTLFVLSICPSLQVTYWWISLRMYTSLISITQLVFDQGFTSIFNTKRGQIGIKKSSLDPQAFTSILSTKIVVILNALSVLRHLYFMISAAPWLMVVFLMNNMYAMAKQLRLKGRQHLQMNVIL
eukprot:217485_1